MAELIASRPRGARVRLAEHAARAAKQKRYARRDRPLRLKSARALEPLRLHRRALPGRPAPPARTSPTTSGRSPKATWTMRAPSSSGRTPCPPSPARSAIAPASMRVCATIPTLPWPSASSSASPPSAAPRRQGDRARRWAGAPRWWERAPPGSPPPSSWRGADSRWCSSRLQTSSAAWSPAPFPPFDSSREA